MPDDPRLAPLGKFTPEGVLTPGYGESYLFFVGRDDVHQILLYLITHETRRFRLNMFGYDDAPLNAAILVLMKNPNVAVQCTLDRSQAGGATEGKILAADVANNPDFYNSFAVGMSATHQISHTKGGVLSAQGLWFEGSTNWSASGEGTGIKLDPRAVPAPGFRSQNNTLLVSANAVNLIQFSDRLDVEHLIAIQQQAARAAKEVAAAKLPATIAPPWCYRSVMSDDETRMTLRLPARMREQLGATASQNRRSVHAQVLIYIELGLAIGDTRVELELAALHNPAIRAAVKEAKSGGGAGPRPR